MAGYCEQPASSGWFAAGDGGTGRESVLIVNNPSEVDTQLMLEFHFSGKVVTERYVIAGLSEKLISLAAIVGVEPSYALYFESGGGPLSVALQHRYSDGLTPLGVSLTTAIREPATELWLAPVDVLAEGFEKRITPLDRNTLVGAALFGVGWGLSGVCPGPAIAALGTGNTEVLWALAGVVLGGLAHGLTARD